MPRNFAGLSYVDSNEKLSL